MTTKVLAVFTLSLVLGAPQLAGAVTACRTAGITLR